MSILKGGARKKLMAAAAAVTPEEWKAAEEAKCLRWELGKCLSSKC